MNGIFFTVFLGLGSVFLFGIIIFIIKRYKVCPPNKILVVYGKVGKNAALTYNGGAKFIIPVIQKYQFLDLAPMTIEIDLQGALSKQNIRVHVPSKFTVAIGTTSELMMNASTSFLGKTHVEIQENADNIILGQLRATIATMNIEEINADRQGFEHKVIENIETELKKVGLKLINVNITDIKDDSGYIDALGQKAASEAINKAKVAVAQQNKLGAEGTANAMQEERIAVEEADALAVEGENLAKVRKAQSNALFLTEEARAKAEAKSMKEIAEAQSEKAALDSQVLTELARAKREEAQKQADIIVPAEIEKSKLVIEAEARNQEAVLEGEARGLALKAELEGKALGERALLEAKAEGFKKIVEAAGEDAEAAAMLLIIEQLPQLVKAQAEAIKNIKFDKVIVMDGGGKGGGTAGFVNSFANMLPSLHEMAQSAGLELPKFMGKKTEETEEKG